MGQREFALVYSPRAEPAGSRGSRPSHYAPGQVAGARFVGTQTDGWEPDVPPSPVVSFCSATTRAGNDCKARPVHGTDLCIGHTNQKAAESCQQ